MGTNYYALPDVCECCNRPQAKIHIGKSGRMLRGWPQDSYWQQGPDVPITTWAEWKAFLRGDPKMAVEDEYGRRMTVDELIDYFESTPVVDRGKQHRYMLEHGYDMKDELLDPDGFSVSLREFF